jgi:2-isopropylmalate synthase
MTIAPTSDCPDNAAATAAATQRFDGCLPGLDLPPGLRAEFAALVQARADAGAGEMSAVEMWDMFEREYLLREPASALLIRCSARPHARPADPWMTLFNIRQSIGIGEDNATLVVAGTLTALGLDAAVLRRYSQMLEASGLIAVYVECLSGFRVWGAGLGGDLTGASLKAVLSAVSRAELKRAQVRAA